MGSLSKVIIIISLGMIGVVEATTTIAQSESNLYIYPKAGQTPQQQTQDQETCKQWALEQSAFDPNLFPPKISPSTVSSSGSLTAESTENSEINTTSTSVTRFKDDPLFGRITRANFRTEQQRWNEYQQEQIERQYGLGLSDHNRAFISCMAAKNYEVR
jgi:hypothetical protein